MTEYDQEAFIASLRDIEHGPIKVWPVGNVVLGKKHPRSEGMYFRGKAERYGYRVAAVLSDAGWVLYEPWSDCEMRIEWGDDE